MDPRFDPVGGSATLRRDRELRALRRTRRWIVVGSLGAVAAIGAWVAQIKPGRSSADVATGASSGATASAATGSVTHRLPPLSSADVGSVPQEGESSEASTPQPPAAAPAPAPAPAPAAPVVSGGS